MLELKTCVVCNEIKELSKFPKDSKNEKIYYRSKCTSCSEKARRDRHKPSKQVMQETPILLKGQQEIDIPIAKEMLKIDDTADMTYTLSMQQKQEIQSFKRTYKILETNARKLQMLKTLYPMNSTFDEIVNDAIRYYYDKKSKE